MREILILTSAYVRPYVRTDSGEGGGKSKGNPMEEGESRGAFGQSELLLAGNRMTILIFEKEVSLKAKAYLAKRLFDRVVVLNLRKKHLISINEKNTQLSFR